MIKVALKKVKISKLLFRDFLFYTNEINLEKSVNRGLETLGSILIEREPLFCDFLKGLRALRSYNFRDFWSLNH